MGGQPPCAIQGPTQTPTSSGSMNFYQRANLTGSFFVLTFLITGVAFNSLNKDSIDSYISKDNYTCIWIFVFIINFRIKLLVDDHKYFMQSNQSKNYFTRFIGFIIGIYSWVFWGFASLSIMVPDKSSELLFCAICLNTVWIVVHLIETRKQSDSIIKEDRDINFIWLLFNTTYMLLLTLFVGSGFTGINILLRDSFYFNPLENSKIVFIIMNLIVVLDYYISKSHENILV